MRYLFVVPRFGSSVAGGAERLAALIATRGIGPGDDATIASTCAIDHHTWANELPAGRSVEDGLVVHRFPVGPRNLDLYHQLHARLLAQGHLPYLDELAFHGNGVWSPDLQDFLRTEGSRYDLIFFVPYLFGTTYWGMQVHPERSVLIPCLHDEPYAYMQATREMIEASAGCLFNTPAEQRLAARLCALPPSAIVGLGFDPPETTAESGFSRIHGIGRYVVYLGRLEEGKGVDVAVQHVARYARERAPDLRLVLVGAGPYRPPKHLAEYVRFAGWLSESEKRSALFEAVALINPSRMESLSIVLMESWLEGVPALVSADAEVMREHCETSGGGFAFRDYADFSTCLTRLLSEPVLRTRMGEAGRAYVHETMNWDAVRQRFQDATRAIVDGRLRRR